MTREEKLETIVKLFAKSMFYGEWEWETPNERVIEMLMKEVGYYPFPNEDAMIFSTKVDDELYLKAKETIKGRKLNDDEKLYPKSKETMEDRNSNDTKKINIK